MQTGAGKTFSMAGDLRNYQHRGIIPRAISHVFREMDMRVDKIYKAHVGGTISGCNSHYLGALITMHGVHLCTPSLLL